MRQEGSQVSDRHIFAADRLRAAVDIAALGLSGLRDILPINSVTYRPKSGPSQTAQKQARACVEVARVWRLYTLGQRDLLIAVVIQNRTLATWCRSREKPISPARAMGMLLFCLDTLEAHYASEIDDDLAHGRVAAA